LLDSIFIFFVSILSEGVSAQYEDKEKFLKLRREACLKAAKFLGIKKYPRPDPINLGTKEEISVRDLARLIVKLAGTETKIVFDQAKPSGQPRRNCAAGKAQKLLGFKAETTLNQGLPQVIDYYKKTHG